MSDPVKSMGAVSKETKPSTTNEGASAPSDAQTTATAASLATVTRFRDLTSAHNNVQTMAKFLEKWSMILDAEVFTLTGTFFPTASFVQSMLKYGEMSPKWASRQMLQADTLNDKAIEYCGLITPEFGRRSDLGVESLLTYGIDIIIEYLARTNHPKRTQGEIYAMIFLFVWRYRENGYSKLGCFLILYAFGMLNFGDGILKVKEKAENEDNENPTGLGELIWEITDERKGEEALCTDSPLLNLRAFVDLVNYLRKRFASAGATEPANVSGMGPDTSVPPPGFADMSSIQEPSFQLKSALKRGSGNGASQGILASTRLDTSGLTDLTSNMKPREDLVKSAIERLYRGVELDPVESSALYQHWAQKYNQKVADRIEYEIEQIRDYYPSPGLTEKRASEIEARVTSILRESNAERSARAPGRDRFLSFYQRVEQWPIAEITSTQACVDFAVRMIDKDVPVGERGAKLKDILNLLRDHEDLTPQQRRYATQAYFEMPNTTVVQNTSTYTSMYDVDSSPSYVPFPILGTAAHPSDRAIKQLRNAGIKEFELHKTDFYTHAFLTQVANTCAAYGWSAEALFECMQVLASNDCREFFLMYMNDRKRSISVRRAVEELWNHVQTLSSARVDFESIRRQINDLIDHPNASFGKTMHKVWRLRTLMHKDNSDGDPGSAYNDVLQDARVFIHRWFPRDFNLIMSSWSEHCKKAGTGASGAPGYNALITVVNKLVGDQIPRPSAVRDHRIPAVTGVRPKARVAAVDVDELELGELDLQADEISPRDSISQAGSRASQRSRTSTALMHEMLSRLDTIDSKYEALSADVAYIRGNKGATGAFDVTQCIPKNPEACRLCNQTGHLWKACPAYANASVNYFRHDRTHCDHCGGCHRSLTGNVCWKLRGKTQPK